MTSTLPPLAVGRFVGQSVNRKEDPRLITGHGRYVDDVVLPGLLHAVFVRSHVARGRIVRIDTTKARAADGVLAVLTAEDLNRLLVGPMVPSLLLGQSDGVAPLQPLADGGVCFVGDLVALVIARDRYRAEDAADLVDVEYEPLPPVLDFELAADDTENLVHPERKTNVASRSEVVVDAELRELFDSAPHVVTATFHQQRQTNVPMEPRGVVAHWDPFDGQLTVYLSTQSPHEARLVASRITGVPENRVRVIMGDVGGGFGQKAFVLREEMVIILAAHLLAKPIKWIEDRRENLMASNTARTERVTMTMAVDNEGHIQGAAIDHLDDLGAWPMAGGAALLMVMMLPGGYRIPRVAWRTTSVWTNTCGRAPYRGPWQMETMVREQMMDLVARDIGMDPLEFRRRNVIHRAELPLTSATGMTLDKISPEETLDQAAEMIDYASFRHDQATDRERGHYRGVGIGLYVEPQATMGPYGTEAVEIRIRPSGKVEAYIGSGSHGQGLETTTAQLVAEHLGVDMDDVSVHQGDTESTPYSPGTGGSRSGPILGAAVRQGALELREKVLGIAAHLLEAAPDDLDIEAGVISVRGTPTAALSLTDIAMTAYFNTDALPAGVQAGLEVTSRYKAPPFVFSNACHVCTCDVDPSTGVVRLLRYAVSEDCGVMINPAIVEGQIAGGVAQGIGGALYEHAIYDGDGNPVTTTFLDYLIPLATEVPVIEYGHIQTVGSTPGDFKGVGEGGAIGAPPAVVNAVIDALTPFGVRTIAPPLTPDAILEAIEAATQH